LVWEKDIKISRIYRVINFVKIPKEIGLGEGGEDLKKLKFNR
jgi:hypothetical protein